MSTTTEYDIDELVKGSVDSITPKLGDLSDGDLAKLADAEKAGSNRKGLTDAVGREQAARKAEAGNPSPDEGDDDDGGFGPSPETPDANDDDPDGARYSQKQVDAIMGEHKTELARATADADSRVKAMEAELAEARQQVSQAAKAQRPAKAVKPQAPRKLALTGEAGKDGLRVAFAGDDDMTLPGLPELEFGPEAFRRLPDGRTTLEQPVRFGPETPRAVVSSIWLVDGNGKAAGVSRLVNPLAVGGGSEAEIPKGFLAFAGDVPARANEPAVLTA